MKNGSMQKEQKQWEKLIAQNMAKISSKILVLSNKGGVGKSFVAVNLAVGLSKKGARVGLLDADIHGPSTAKMLGFENQRVVVNDNGFQPFQINPNLVAISMASFLENPDMPVIWRGPLKMSVINQFLAEVDWGELDYLIVDSPPGTGDEPLSICQLINDLTGAIIVTTPQDLALLDSRKCVNFLKKLFIPILGIVENMSGFTCPHCGNQIDLFKSGGGEKSAKEFDVPFLGRIPFDPRIVESMDNGKPFIELFPESESAKILNQIYNLIEEQIRKIRIK